jgi:hypothetical protein
MGPRAAPEGAWPNSWSTTEVKIASIRRLGSFNRILRHPASGIGRYVNPGQTHPDEPAIQG